MNLIGATVIICINAMHLNDCKSGVFDQQTNLYSRGHIDLYSGGLQKLDGHYFFLPNCQLSQTRFIIFCTINT